MFLFAHSRDQIRLQFYTITNIKGYGFYCVLIRLWIPSPLTMLYVWIKWCLSSRIDPKRSTDEKPE